MNKAGDFDERLRKLFDPNGVHTKDNDTAQVITLLERPIGEIKSILDLGLRHDEQIKLLKKVQAQILKLGF